jgi:DNA repair protein RadC
VAGNSHGHNLVKIKDLPPLMRPREKALRYGVESLADHELLAILIGAGTKEFSSLDIAYAMINENRGLYNLANLPVKELFKYKGIKHAKGLNLIAIFELAKRYRNYPIESKETIFSTEDLFNRNRYKFQDLKSEEFQIVILNKKKVIVHEITHFKGTSTKLSFTYRDIFKQVINNNGYYLYVIHNHPNDCLTPSKEDVEFTKELTKFSNKMQITVLDHIIISKSGYYSFFENKSHLNGENVKN